ncbi:glycosylase [Opitutus sp. GAS368]|uniref:glycosylase n=1 Tax=Opitutus sp. GAS368 TaxID=1882749 RepID=UPI00087A1575|nr:glycosylase [Opitutus sp. GAS368]SDS27391.1 hypothetical protein SAMN05444173_2395 [Opitutus sp. GAS368]
MAIWRKLGRIFKPQDHLGRPWMHAFAQAPSTVLMEDRLRVYFSCRPSPEADGSYVSYTAYVDFDRQDLTRIIGLAETPIMPLGGVGEFDEFGTYPVSVIRVDHEFHAYYGGWTRCESVPFDVAIGKAVSRDNGVTFTKLDRGPVLGPSLHEPFILSGPKIRRYHNEWFLWYIAGRKWLKHNDRMEPVYKIRMARSSDGVTWRRENRDLITNVLEEDEAQASPDVFFKDGLWHMFFCYRYSVDYRGKEKGYRIGYAKSADALNWVRCDENAGIGVSADGWDSEMVSYPHVFELNDSIYMLYLGNQVGREGFGFAVLEDGSL